MSDIINVALPVDSGKVIVSCATTLMSPQEARAFAKQITDAAAAAEVHSPIIVPSAIARPV